MTDIEELLRETAEEEARQEAAGGVGDGRRTLAEAAAEVEREETSQREERSQPLDGEDDYDSESYEADSPKARPSHGALADDSSDESTQELTDGDVQLQIHCFRGNTDGLEKILSQDSSARYLTRGDRHGWTPLHWCASKGHLEAMKVILEHSSSKAKAVVDIQDGIVGWTPLHVSVCSSPINALTLLQLASIGGHVVSELSV